MLVETSYSVLPLDYLLTFRKLFGSQIHSTCNDVVMNIHMSKELTFEY